MLITLQVSSLIFIIGLCPAALAYNFYPPERSTPPRFIYHEETTIDRFAFQSANFSCKTVSSRRTEPTLTRWYKNGQLLDNTFFKWNTRYSDTKEPQNLLIRNLMNEDIGSYVCNVSNRAGYIIRNFSLDIINYCDLYAQAEYTAIHLIPLRCLCLWYTRFDCMKKGINSSKVNNEVCEGYTSRATHMVLPVDCEESVNISVVKEATRPQQVIEQTPVPTTALPEAATADDEFYGIDLKPHESLHGFPHYPHVVESDADSRDQRARDVEQEYFKRKPPKKPPAQKIKYRDEEDSYEAISAEVTVAPPVFTAKNPKLIDLGPTGKTVQLNCRFRGNAEIMWEKDGMYLKNVDRDTGERKDYKDVPVLTIAEAVPADSGYYTCKVYNSGGTISRQFTVSIYDRSRARPTMIPNVMVDQNVTVNGDANFTCQVLSDLTPHFRWFHVAKDAVVYLNTTDNNFVSNFTMLGMHNDTHTRREVFADKTSVLTIYNVTKDDEGYYLCDAGTTLGTARAKAYLNVTDKKELAPPPDTMSTISTVSISVSVIGLLLVLFFALWLIRFYCVQKSKNQIGQMQSYGGPERKKVVITKKVPTPGEEDSGGLSAYHVQFFPLPSTNRRRQANGGGREPLYSQLTEYIMEPDPEWEIDRSRLTLLEQMGEGAFGKVYKASLKLSEGSDLMKANGKEDNEILVAVKRLKPNAQDKEMDDLIREMITFQNIGQHDNILRLIGCSTQNGPLYVVLELCKHGNLRDFLRAHRPRDNDQQPNEAKESDGYLEARKASAQSSISSKDEQIALINPLTLRHLVQFAWQVARGMQYMTSRKIIHRDLAARNILVADDFVLKISDFGLSRDVHYNDYYRKKGNGRLPIKWMALEALDSHVYTVYSDVWSFGILLWEIITLGGTPYPSIAMQQLYSCLKEGYRMEAPDNCPEEIYNAMAACWQEDPKQRPTFDVLVDYFDWMLNQSASEQEKYLDLKSTDGEEDGCKAESSPLLDGPENALKKLRTRPLSEPIIRTPARDAVFQPINDFEDESEDDGNDTKSLIHGEKAVLCGRVDQRKSSYAVLRRCKDTKLPSIITSKNVDSKAASIDSAIGSPGWQMENETTPEPIKLNPEVSINEECEKDTAPLLTNRRMCKQESLRPALPEYYNCPNVFRESLNPRACESYCSRQLCHSDSSSATKTPVEPSSLSSSPGNDVFIPERQPTASMTNRMPEKADGEAEMEGQVDGRHRRFSDDSSSSGRGSGTSTEGFGIGQYCTIVESSSPSSKLFPFMPPVFPDPFCSKTSPHDMKFFT